MQPLRIIASRLSFNGFCCWQQINKKAEGHAKKGNHTKAIP